MFSQHTSVTFNLMEHYRLFDHTADLGMEFFGESLKKLFVSAGIGLFDVITDLNEVNPSWHFNIEIDGIDIEDLLINWLRELLYLHQVKKMLLKEFVIDEIGETFLKGYAVGEPIDEEKHVVKKEVKAATYHGVELREEAGQWSARVVFDL